MRCSKKRRHLYATDKSPRLKPYSWYLRFVVEGAKQHGLPEEYVATLEAVRAIEDPDKERDQPCGRAFPVFCVNNLFGLR